MPREQRTSPKGVETYNQKNIEALHFVLKVVGYIVKANNDPTGYNY